MQRKNLAKVYFLIGVCGAFSWGNPLWLAVALFLIVLYEFQSQLDQGFPLVQLTGLIAVLQWLIGPAIAYRTNFDLGRGFMRVGEAEYFSYVMPATSAFLIGMYLFRSSVSQRSVVSRLSSEYCLMAGLFLNGIAFAAEIAGRMGPSGLAFAFFLLAQLRYVGVLYFFLWDSRYKWALILLCLFPLVLGSVESAMFHSLLIWGAIIFCYWYALRKRPVYQKWAFLLAGGLVVFVIQEVKQDYRSKVWAGQEASLIDEIASSWSDHDSMLTDKALGGVVFRINQGWIIASVMANVPAIEPYAKGETIVGALRSSLLPRFLDPGKAGAGGQENFRRFTGLPLGDSTSMGVSPVGEAYGNFGSLGGVFAMLVYGGLFGCVAAGCFRFVENNPDFLFWVPLVFYQAIKAETDFVTILNQISKGGGLAFGCYWVISNWVLPSQSRCRFVEEGSGLAAGFSRDGGRELVEDDDERLV